MARGSSVIFVPHWTQLPRRSSHGFVWSQSFGSRPPLGTLNRLCWYFTRQ
jgi:hypothetical protein